MPLEAMKADGYFLESITSDGRIHRFKRDKDDKGKSAWYVSSLFHSRAGTPFTATIYGDWREGGFNKHCSLVGATNDDNTFIKAQFEKAHREFEAEQKKVWEETATQATQAWNSYSMGGTSEYLVRKKIQAYGIKFDGQIICIPVKDENEKIWGIQRIAQDGTKLFMPGCRVAGNFFRIGPESKIYLVCEGYATGASLYEATGMSVLVAFNAGNLPKVCSKFPDSHLKVCGDDDKWTEGNPGKTYAQKCACENVVFPAFRDESTHPTDFNDLHNLEGLDAVKAQVMSEKSERQYLLCLGHKEETYFYTASSNKRISPIHRGSHTRAILRDLMPEAWFEARYPGVKGGANWDQAADSLMQQCRAKGIFDEAKVKGVGVWKDKDIYLINTGDSLYYDNGYHALDSLKGDTIYEIGPKLPELSNGVCDTNLILLLLNTVSWKRMDSARFLAGYLVVAPVAGAINWRPHLWLTGGAGTGKTTIMQSVIKPMLGPMCHYFLGNTSEAGLRQITRNESKAVICDEFETEDEKSGHRIRAILEFFRQASSESDGIVAKGTSAGQAMTFRPRFAALVSSIRVGLVHEADRMRFNELELERIQDPAAFDEFLRLSSMITEDYAAKFFARTFNLLPVLASNIQTLWNVLRLRYSARIGQQYGALLAGYWLIEHDTPISEHDAHGLINSLTLDEMKQSIQEKEEKHCLEYLLEKLVSLDHGVSKTIGELLDPDKTSPEISEPVLARYGIRFKDGICWIATKNAELSRLFHNTPWAQSWGKSMKRLPDSDAASIRIGSKTCYAIGLKNILE